MASKIRATTLRNRTDVFDKLGGNPIAGVVLKVPTSDSPEFERPSAAFVAA